MKKRLLKVAVTTALAVAFAVPAFANPFSDVPTHSWAYAAVTKLAQEGIVDGYGDGTFRGDKPITRYEMAQIVAKAMTKNLNPEQQATVDRLSKEYATELNTLGVKVDGLQDQMDNMVKISGDARMRYGDSENTSNKADFRARITFDGKISDNVHFNARLTSGNVDMFSNDSSTGVAGSHNAAIALDTANVSFKALGFDNTVGRQDVYLDNGLIADTQMTGFGTQIGDLKMLALNKNSDRVYAGEYNTNIGIAKLGLDYTKDDTAGTTLYGANTSFGLIKNVTANASYLKNDTTGETGKVYGVKFDKLGLSATYRDLAASTYTPWSTMASDIDPIASGTAIKGMEYQYDKTLDKNVGLTVKYQNFDNLPKHTSAYVNVKF